MFQQTGKTRELFEFYAALLCGIVYSYLLYNTIPVGLEYFPETYNTQADVLLYPPLSRLTWLTIYLLVGFSAYAISHFLVWRTFKARLVNGKLNFLFVSILGFLFLDSFATFAFIWRCQLSLDGFDRQLLVVFPLVCLFWGVVASIPILLFSLCGQLLVRLFSRQNSLP